MLFADRGVFNTKLFFKVFKNDFWTIYLDTMTHVQWLTSLFVQR